MNRRDLLTLLPAACLTRLGSRPASSGAGPSRGCLQGGRVRWLVGWSAGGGYDAYSRLSAPLLETAWDARIAVDNQPGAAGRIAATQLARAKPDGRTIGILDAPGLLLWAARGDRNTPVVERDFTLLARVARTDTIMVTSARSGIRSLEELREVATRRPIVFGSTAPGSQNFVLSAATVRLLDMDSAFVVGYPGSAEVILGLIRGDSDALCLNADSLLDQVESGDVVPLATVLPQPSADPPLSELPVLTDAATLRVLRAGIDRDPAPELAIAQSVGWYIGAGRLLAAPAGLPDEIRDCLVAGLREVLTGAALRTAAARARRTLNVAFGDDMQRDVRAAGPAVRTLLTIALDAERRVR